MDFFDLAQRFGLPIALLMMALGAYHFGQIVSKSQHDRELEALRDSKKEALEARDKQYDAMQTAWSLRYEEVAAERDFLKETGEQNTESLSQSTALLIELVRGRKEGS